MSIMKEQVWEMVERLWKGSYHEQIVGQNVCVLGKGAMFWEILMVTFWA